MIYKKKHLTGFAWVWEKSENTVVLFRAILLPADLVKQDIAACWVPQASEENMAFYKFMEK